MRRLSLNGALFIFMERGEKLTYDAIWNQNIWPSQRYVIWPRAGFWDVRYKTVEDGKLNWLPVVDALFANEDEAMKAALDHWESQPKYTRHYNHD